MKKIIVVFGTRPEVIKLAPVINELKKYKKLQVTVCSTGQHNEMLEQMITFFGLKVDYNFNLMKHNQNLADLTSAMLSGLNNLFETQKPDLVIVQGDTTTAFTASLTAFYNRIKIAHVEAGLRSGTILSPFPEEANRRIISLTSAFHFSPTKKSKENLIKEGINPKNIWVTGNTVVDSVLEVKEKLSDKKFIQALKKDNSSYKDFFNNEYILITMHRREKFGEQLNKILLLFAELAKEFPQYKFVYPVHLNPNVNLPVYEKLKSIKNFILIPPTDYFTFMLLMKNSRFIISDSGGIQEECFSFKKPVIVLREVTERGEAVDAGYAFLAGHSPEKIKKIFYDIDKKISRGYNFFKKKNPFGDGKASCRIAEIINKKLTES